MTENSRRKDQLTRTLKIIDQWQRGVSPLIQTRAADLLILRYLGFLDESFDELTPEGRRFLLLNKMA
jgi:hypothetical protein